MRTYKKLDNDMNNYESKVQKYKSKMKQAKKEKKQRTIQFIGNKFLKESHINIDDIHQGDNILNSYSFIKQSSKQEKVNQISSDILNKFNINKDDILKNKDLLDKYSLIDKKRIDKYHRNMYNYQLIIKPLERFAFNMYTTNEGNNYISKHDLPQLSAWLYKNFRSNNSNDNKGNNNEYINNEGNNYDQ